MTPKIFATEVKKPVSRLCRLEGEKRKKKRRKKKRKEASAHFPDSMPLCHSSSFFLPLFIILRHRSLLLFHFSPAFPSLPPLDCIFFHHFPGSIDIDRLWNVIVVPRRFSGRFHEFSRNFGRTSLLPTRACNGEREPLRWHFRATG